VNCDRFQQLCRQLGIKAYPTVKYFPGNTDRGENINARDGPNILDIVEKLKSAARKKSLKIRDEL
jgi:hypothetical protein